MPIEAMVVVVVITALVFDFTNGFHDSANAMATAVATGAYKPKRAVLLAAVMNLVGACLSTEVALTISHGIVDDSLVTVEMVFAGLVGAILWNLVTWLLGLPSSSSHAMFGGLVGAVVVMAGVSGIHPGVILSKILLPALVAPVVAGLASYGATKIAYRSFRDSSKGSKKRFRTGQRASSLMVALAHGTSDGQKTMGVITLVLVAGGMQAPGTAPHWWVIGAAGLAIAAGTYSGGWRIMRTMGKGMADIEGPQGFAAETSAMAAILASSHFGFGLSTTHVVSGAVMGTGLGRTPDQVRWNTAGRMALGWLLTLPASALVGAGAALLAHQGVWGFGLVVAILVAAAGAIKIISQRNHVSPDNVNDDHEVRVFGRADKAAPVTTQGALATPLAPSLPKGITAEHPLAATPLVLTRLKQPKRKKVKGKHVPLDQDPLPGLAPPPDPIERSDDLPPEPAAPPRDLAADPAPSPSNSTGPASAAVPPASDLTVKAERTGADLARED
jgi:PiT family inorganic phosphate transporter